MAEDKRVLVFNAEPISREAALEKLKATYGEKRPPEILTGLKSGKYTCASVAGGHIYLALPVEPETAAEEAAAETPVPPAAPSPNPPAAAETNAS